MANTPGDCTAAAAEAPGGEGGSGSGSGTGGGRGGDSDGAVPRRTSLTVLVLTVSAGGRSADGSTPSLNRSTVYGKATLLPAAVLMAPRTPRCCTVAEPEPEPKPESNPAEFSPAVDLFFAKGDLRMFDITFFIATVGPAFERLGGGTGAICRTASSDETGIFSAVFDIGRIAVGFRTAPPRILLVQGACGGRDFLVILVGTRCAVVTAVVVVPVDLLTE